jgi:hypothetical protein
VIGTILLTNRRFAIVILVRDVNLRGNGDVYQGLTTFAVRQL